MGNHWQLPTAQAGKHQLAAREAPVCDLPRHQVVARLDCAYGDLELNTLLVAEVAAHELEAVAFDHWAQLDRAAFQKVLNKLVPAEVANRQYQRLLYTVTQAQVALVGEGIVAVHGGNQLLLNLGNALDI